MKNFYDVLNQYISENHPNFGDGESVLTMLYEAYSECNRLDDTQVKEDFSELYRLMNGMELREMDKIIYPVCKLCRDHERSGFIEGIKKLIDVKFVEIDERMSTVSAHNALLTFDVSRKKRKQVVDKVAATVILQSYLDRNSRLF